MSGSYRRRESPPRERGDYYQSSANIRQNGNSWVLRRSRSPSNRRECRQQSPDEPGWYPDGRRMSNFDKAPPKGPSRYNSRVDVFDRPREGLSAPPKGPSRSNSGFDVSDNTKAPPSPYESRDPRKVGRLDTSVAPVNGSLSSASIGESTREIKSGSAFPAQKSGLSSSITAPDPPSPKTQTLPQTSEPQAHVDRLINLLGNFAKHVTATASISMQKDGIKKKVDQKAKDLIKRQKYKDSFPSLTEADQAAMKSAEAELAKIDSKLEEHVMLRDNLARTIALNILSNESQSHNTQEEEIKDIKAELKKLRTESSETNSQIRGFKPFRSAVEKLESRTVFLEKSQSEQAKLIALRTADLQASQSLQVKLKSQLEKLQERAEKIPNLALEISKVKEKLNATDVLAQEQDTALKGLKNEVQQAQAEKVQAEKVQVEPQNNAEIYAVLESIKTDFQTLSEELSALQKDQETKDDLVGAAVEDLRNVIEDAKSEIVVMVNQSIADANKRIDVLAARPSPAVVTTAPPPPQQNLQAQQNLQPQQDLQAQQSLQAEQSPQTQQSHQVSLVSGNRATTSTAEIMRQIGDLNHAIMNLRQVAHRQGSTMTVFQEGLQSLESRYNNLTTEPLVRHMTLQMQEMYPYASTMQREVEWIRGQIAQLQQRLDKTPQDLNNLAVQFQSLSQEVDLLKEGFKTGEEERKGVDGKHDGLVKSMTEERDKLSSRMDNVLIRVRDMEKTIAKEIATLVVKVERLEEHCDILLPAKGVPNLVNGEHMDELDDDDDIMDGLPEEDIPDTQTGVDGDNNSANEGSSTSSAKETAKVNGHAPSAGPDDESRHHAENDDEVEGENNAGPTLPPQPSPPPPPQATTTTKTSNILKLKLKRKFGDLSVNDNDDFRDEDWAPEPRSDPTPILESHRRSGSRGGRSPARGSRKVKARFGGY